MWQPSHRPEGVGTVRSWPFQQAAGPARSGAHSSDHTAHVCDPVAQAHLHGGGPPAAPPHPHLAPCHVI